MTDQRSWGLEDVGGLDWCGVVSLDFNRRISLGQGYGLGLFLQFFTGQVT